MEIFFLVIVIFAIVWAANQVTSGNKFRDDSQKIRVGMTVDEVTAIMGAPTFVKNHADGSFEYVYEKSEWKGFFRGGTATRRMEIVLSGDGTVISIGKNENCDKSGW